MLGLWLFTFVIFFNFIFYFGGEDAEILFFLFLAFQILHVFLPDISSSLSILTMLIYD
jgi:hypothetical protein